MTTLSASDVAARRIREARTRHKWSVKDLAAACKKAGVPDLTAAVITNLETRRRPGREITADELIALALVLDVPPVQLLSPLDGTETLQVVPGQEKGPLEATAWLADDDAVLEAVRRASTGRAEDTERVLRYRGSPLTMLRQVRATASRIKFNDQFLTSEEWAKTAPGTPAFHKNTVTILAIQLLHLLDSLDALGYTRPPLDDVMAILARHGIPATLAEWDERDDEREVPDGART